LVLDTGPHGNGGERSQNQSRHERSQPAPAQRVPGFREKIPILLRLRGIESQLVERRI
jgi:hypothetical protein